jgi:hypothetical protein
MWSIVSPADADAQAVDLALRKQHWGCPILRAPRSIRAGGFYFNQQKNRAKSLFVLSPGNIGSS